MVIYVGHGVLGLAGPGFQDPGLRHDDPGFWHPPVAMFCFLSLVDRRLVGQAHVGRLVGAGTRG
jgi:hypothetical protein